MVIRISIVIILICFCKTIFAKDCSLNYNDSLTNPIVYDSGDPDFDLILAAESGDEIVVRELVQNGADVNVETLDGVTPLMYASEKGFYSICEFLILNGAFINKQPEIGPPALTGAIRGNKKRLVELLIQNKADINIRDNYGATPLHHAAALGLDEMVDILLFYGASIKIKDNLGTSVLMAACMSGNKKIIDRLVTKEAEIGFRDQDNFTPAFVASQQGHLEVLDFLYKRGADLNVKNEANWSPLSAAIFQKKVKVVEYLLKKGVDLNQLISLSESNLSIAKQGKDKELIRLLKERGAKETWAPNFYRFSPNYELLWNREEFMMGPGVEFLEQKYGLSVSVGFLFRVKRSRVLVEKSEYLFYQYRERRNIFYTGLSKKISVFDKKDHSVQILLGLDAGYTYGNYSGTSEKPDDEIVLLPKIGVVYCFKKFRIGYGYRFSRYNISYNRLEKAYFSLGYSFNLKRQRNRIKVLPWL